MMKNKVELPLAEPKFSTYHGQGAACAMTAGNPSIWNWFLNESVNLVCERDFLFGYSSPQMGIQKTSPTECPWYDKRVYHMQFTKGYINQIIRIMLDNGYYAFFDGIDDYYMEGKTWYKERHFSHDGLICGYDDDRHTYSVFAYDKNWVFRKFDVPMKCFEAGRKSMFRQGKYGWLYGFCPHKNQVDFSANLVLRKLREYVDSNLEHYPPTEKGTVYGIAVQDYVVKYLDMHIDGSIPYEKLDRRVFRLIWEHKKVMLERLQKIEEELCITPCVSQAYVNIVKEADTMRMLYASHHMRRRDSVLSIIKRKLINMNIIEKQLLENIIENMEGKTTNGTMGMFEK